MKALLAASALILLTTPAWAEDKEFNLGFARPGNNRLQATMNARMKQPAAKR